LKKYEIYRSYIFSSIITDPTPTPIRFPLTLFSFSHWNLVLVFSTLRCVYYLVSTSRTPIVHSVAIRLGRKRTVGSIRYSTEQVGMCIC